ncbi:MAG: calcium-binding protein [Synechococcales cyanobacterium C42_A2020_086]|jgi:Ca2+-binding RTX toxin-like protein|nr:calcium-binding protein [Synechococcales cyanobacterium C42_A2020_086]
MARIDGTNNNDRLFGTGADDFINGFGGNDELFGDSGNDILDGGTGVDTMRGGSGDDFYLVDNSADVVIENPNDGIDTVSSTANFTLSANVENLFLRENATIGIGNELDNIIQLPTATLTSAPSVSLSGLGGNDRLVSGIGNDTLDGGTGNDTMNGGGGNDTYRVDSVGDVIQEAVNGGIDTVISSVDHTLAANVENLTLFNVATQSTAFNGTGNELNNVILGNAFNNTLRGLAGDDSIDGGSGIDTLEGGDGNDTLIGNLGNDILDGGTGNDRMLGDFGNDIYIVTDAGDLVDEGDQVLAGNPSFGGVDLVRSTVDFTLGRHLENLTLEGTAVNGTGNELNNEIIGNDIANVLEGLAGNDRILGGNGNDILRGGLGNDNLQGDRGRDTMTGGEGADGFFFDLNAPFNLGAIGRDVIRDFTSGVDRIVLDETTFGPLSRNDVALVANDRDAAASAKKIVFSEATGRLFFNANGSARGFGNNGSGGYFVTLQGAVDFAISDITFQP